MGDIIAKGIVAALWAAVIVAFCVGAAVASIVWAVVQYG